MTERPALLPDGALALGVEEEVQPRVEHGNEPPREDPEPAAAGEAREDALGQRACQRVSGYGQGALNGPSCRVALVNLHP